MKETGKDPQGLPEEESLEYILHEDEKILWEGSPKKSAYIAEGVLRMLPLVIFWAAFDVAIIVLLIRVGVFRDVPWLVYVLVPFFLLHLAPVWIWLFGIVKRFAEHKNIRYVVTDRRILVRQGFIGIDYRTINYKDIDSVKLKVGWDDKLLKVGDIFLYGNRTRESISDVEEPYKAYKIIQKIVLDMQADIHFPNELRPGGNKGYRTEYMPDREEK